MLKSGGDANTAPCVFPPPSPAVRVVAWWRFGPWGASGGPSLALLTQQEGPVAGQARDAGGSCRTRTLGRCAESNADLGPWSRRTARFIHGYTDEKCCRWAVLFPCRTCHMYAI
ncbi:hypothetical protein C2E23DRAFT_175153 [Lenzites betulinus]|nr:hypothetical protein C2E23DRAFT_175153 [Lenzites betulinus]